MIDDTPDAAVRPAAAPDLTRIASLALMLATVFWGCGFTWAKQGGEAIQLAAGLRSQSPFGPVFLLAWRFTLGGVIWLLIFPAARRGWTLAGLTRSVGVGVLLTVGLVVQHIGLDFTSESVSAFLTSLTILFVPLLMMFAMRRPPKPVLWIGVGLATLGVWLMTGATATGFGRGELLGLSCAFSFSLYILAVNAAASRDIPWRMTAGQFITVGTLCFLTCAVLPGGARNLTPLAQLHILAQPAVGVNLVLLAIFPTIAAFGLLTHFQPHLDPTRAALLYLIEPVVASIYAAIAVHHIPGTHAIAGALLILAANVLVEVLSSRRAKGKTAALSVRQLHDSPKGRPGNPSA